jgi:hypothetical protein
MSLLRAIRRLKENATFVYFHIYISVSYLFSLLQLQRLNCVTIYPIRGKSSHTERSSMLSIIHCVAGIQMHLNVSYSERRDVEYYVNVTASLLRSNAQRAPNSNFARFLRSHFAFGHILDTSLHSLVCYGGYGPC